MAVGAQEARTMVAVQDLAWSADGKRIFFSAMRIKPDFSDYSPAKWSVYRYDVERGELKLVSPSTFSVNTSHRSRRIVVGKLVAGNRDLFVLDEDGRELMRLTTDPAEDFGGSWSPDETRIAFTSKRGGRSEVFVANADGSSARKLVDRGNERTLGPMWSPDGTLIAYYSEKGDGADQVHVVRPDGTDDRNLTNDAFNNVYPSWTPDGRVVYGQGQKGKATTAFGVATDGSAKEPLLGITSFFVRFAPGGKRIAFLEEHPEDDGIRVLIADQMGAVVTKVELNQVGR